MRKNDAISNYGHIPEKNGKVKQTEGNYLGKCRRNFYITGNCWEMLHQISVNLGVNHSGCIELAVRKFYRDHFGEPIVLTYPDRKNRYEV